MSSRAGSIKCYVLGVCAAPDVYRITCCSDICGILNGKLTAVSVRSGINAKSSAL